MMIIIAVGLHRLYLFFFKQKTAYEMRISDWSSDVCSSDLDRQRLPHLHIVERRPFGVEEEIIKPMVRADLNLVAEILAKEIGLVGREIQDHVDFAGAIAVDQRAGIVRREIGNAVQLHIGGIDKRSEAHTSEPPSPMPNW